MTRSLALCLAAACLSAACANPYSAAGIQPGATRDQVLARAGQPTATVPLPSGGQRLQYSLQPMGQHAWMVDLDAAGRVTSSRQVLTLREFSRIEPGTWTRQDVEREFGRPARLDALRGYTGPVMTYRWNDGGDMFWWVYLDDRNVVVRSHQGMEFVNAPDRD
ncbi:MAG: hypothetical protein ABW051_03740 [Burkholderiaceae bacterium]